MPLDSIKSNLFSTRITKLPGHSKTISPASNLFHAQLLRKANEKYQNFTFSKASQIMRRIGSAGLLIASIQGALILNEYRSNPTLSVPPGLTWGIEENMSESHDEIIQQQPENSIFTIQDMKLSNIFGRRKTIDNNGSKNSNIIVASREKSNKAILKKVSNIWAMIVDSFKGKTNSILEKKPPLESLKLVVIGDSLACGIGCVSTREKDPISATTQRAENVSQEDINDPLSKKGPVFPKSFARTLSRRLQRPIKWRSAGVDGGDLTDIRIHCIGVIEEEVKNGHIPDVVVILCGINDLKKKVINPFQSGFASDFRSNLVELIEAIQKHAPNTKIVFPGMPTHKLDKKSVVNVFPLSFFLDNLVWFWDWQKKRVADLSPASIMFFTMPGLDVAEWYKQTAEEGCAEDFDTLISADGVHPNSRCYSRWGEFMANKFCDRLGSFNNTT